MYIFWFGFRPFCVYVAISTTTVFSFGHLAILLYVTDVGFFMVIRVGRSSLFYRSWDFLGVSGTQTRTPIHEREVRKNNSAPAPIYSRKESTFSTLSFQPVSDFIELLLATHRLALLMLPSIIVL